MNFSSKVFLAPMAGITDPAFRALCAQSGAGLTTTELISAQGIVRNNKKTQTMITRAPQEKMFAIQLFGSDPNVMASAAKRIQAHADMIDINMGCPVKKVYELGAGSALLAHPKRAGAIVLAMTRAVSIPISVKMRIGLSSFDEKLAVSVAKACEKNGAAMITVHGRTREQQYRGKANWNAIEKIKNKVTIPVVGNGDITTPENAKEKLKITDYVAIGRASSGNPLLFKNIQDFLRTGKYKQTSSVQRLRMFKRYLAFAEKFHTPLPIQRLQAQHTIKGKTNAATSRLALNKAQSPVELRTIVSDVLKPQS